MSGHKLEIALDKDGRPIAVYLNNYRITGRETKPRGPFETRAFTVEAAEVRAGLKLGAKV